MSAPPRGSDAPVRLTLAATLGGEIDGAWWPYTPAMARELPQLIDVLGSRLGDVVDIAVNWSALDGAPDLNPPPHGGTAALPGQKPRQQRVITITGKKAKVNLLVVPSGTSKALAMMVLRQAANLPIQFDHLDTQACRMAAAIVHTARAECAQRAAGQDTSAPTSGQV